MNASEVFREYRADFEEFFAQIKESAKELGTKTGPVRDNSWVADGYKSLIMDLGDVATLELRVSQAAQDGLELTFFARLHSTGQVVFEWPAMTYAGEPQAFTNEEFSEMWEDLIVGVSPEAVHRAVEDAL